MTFGISTLFGAALTSAPSALFSMGVVAALWGTGVVAGGDPTWNDGEATWGSVLGIVAIGLSCTLVATLLWWVAGRWTSARRPARLAWSVTVGLIAVEVLVFLTVLLAQGAGRS